MDVVVFVVVVFVVVDSDDVVADDAVDRRAAAAAAAATAVIVMLFANRSMNGSNPSWFRRSTDVTIVDVGDRTAMVDSTSAKSSHA